MHAIVTIKYDFHCLKIIIVLCFIIVLFSFELYVVVVCLTMGVLLLYDILVWFGVVVQLGGNVGTLVE
jgi:hypothetical protein